MGSRGHWGSFEMEIRKFKDSDSEGICNLIKRNNLEITSKFYPKEVINNWLLKITPKKILKKSKKRVCFVAEQNRQIISYISLAGNEIKKLFVLPEFHRKGIGKKLMKKIEKVGKENNIDYLIVDSTLYAEPFYKSCGFKKIRNNWQKIGNTKFKFIHMRKEL